MDADYCIRKADYYRTLARQLTDLNDKAKMLDIALYWMTRANDAGEVANKKKKLVRCRRYRFGT
jgi:hypothetical protein